MTTGHEVSCWGSNLLGALGDGATVVRSFPMPVEGLEGLVQISVAAHGCGLLANGLICTYLRP
ncbi:MAG: RCC1 domain-containing protein [Myxococcales bacterium]|nr:RCC1 domain-containing protein [Myxococcales bacterium]